MDASEYAMGMVLLQKQPDNEHWHPVCYRSQAFTETKRNYDVFDRELLSIIRALEEWQHYLQGIPFELHSDHKNLLYWLKKRDISRRQKRWADILGTYNYTLHHKPGKTMYQSNALSRQIQIGRAHV